MISRIDNAKNVTNLDARVLGEVKQFRRSVTEHAHATGGARAAAGAPRRAARRGEALDRVEDRRAAAALRPRSRARSRSCVQAEQARQLQMARAWRRPAWSQQRQAQVQAGTGHGRRHLGGHARSPTRSSRRRRRTAASSRSRCRSSARRTCGAARLPAASTARASSCGRTRRSASRCRTRRMRCSATACRSRVTSSQPGDLVFFDGARARRHLHRRRPVRPRAAHGRRREDLQPRRSVVLRGIRRRAPDPLVVFAYSASTSSAKCSRITLRRSLSVGVTSSSLERELARQDAEALDLLEAATGRR